jgi:iron complex transport system permease protein
MTLSGGVSAMRTGAWAAGGLGAIFLLFCIAATVGQYPLSIAEVLTALGSLVGGTETGSAAETVVLNIRLPRLAAALLVGLALAASGATYQTVFRNPLVAPDILGVSAGAGLGAVTAIFLSLPVPMIQAFAFVFGLLAVIVVYFMSKLVRGVHDPILVLVLSGVVIGAVMGAGISVLTYLADPYDQLPAITFWLMGSLAGITFDDLMAAWPPVLAGIVPLFLLRWRRSLMALDEEEARALGVETGRLRVVLVVAATLMTSSVVAISGTVGWVGLIIPHVARFLVGPEFSRLLPATVLIGAGYLLLVDTIARSSAGIEIPIGILNAFIGAPLFLWILARARRSWR